MAATSQSAIAVIGIDIGKNSFHVVGLDGRGAIVLRQKWSRGQVEARFANMSPCLIGMEACVGAHHLSRKLKALGHDARLMPARYVRPYSKGQKNDFRDAEAIAEAVQRPTMKFVVKAPKHRHITFVPIEVQSVCPGHPDWEPRQFGPELARADDPECVSGKREFQFTRPCLAIQSWISLATGVGR